MERKPLDIIPKPRQNNFDGNYYQILGLDNYEADQKKIKRAYLDSATEFHPDKCKDNKDEATAKFQKIAHAYEMLRDPRQKQAYDQYLGQQTNLLNRAREERNFPVFFKMLFEALKLEISEEDLNSLLKLNVLCELIIEDPMAFTIGLSENILNIPELIQLAALPCFRFTLTEIIFLMKNSGRKFSDIIQVRKKFSDDVLKYFDSNVDRYDVLFSVQDDCIGLIEKQPSLLSMFFNGVTLSFKNLTDLSDPDVFERIKDCSSRFSSISDGLSASMFTISELIEQAKSNCFRFGPAEFRVISDSWGNNITFNQIIKVRERFSEDFLKHFDSQPNYSSLFLVSEDCINLIETNPSLLDWFVNENTPSLAELTSLAALEGFFRKASDKRAAIDFLSKNKDKKLSDIIEIRNKFSAEFLQHFDSFSSGIDYDDLFAIPERFIDVIQKESMNEFFSRQVESSFLKKLGESSNFTLTKEVLSFYINEFRSDRNKKLLEKYLSDDLGYIFGAYGIQKAIKDKILSLDDLKDIPRGYPQYLFTPNGLDFLGKLTIEIAQQSGLNKVTSKIPSKVLSRLLADPLYSQIKSHIFSFVDMQKDLRDFVLSDRCIKAMQEGGVSLFELKSLYQTYTNKDIDDARLDKIFSPVYLKALKEKTLDLNELIEMPLDLFEALEMPGRFDSFIENQQSKVIRQQNISELSKEGLARVFEPSYFKALKALKKDIGMIQNDSPIALYKLERIGFEYRLKDIQSKLDEDSKPNKAARKLLQDLTDARGAFIAFNGDPTEAEKQFILACNKAIELARPELEKDNAWLKILADIANALLFLTTLGLSYVVSGRYSVFSAPKSELGEHVDRTQEAVDMLKKEKDDKNGFQP